MNLSHFLSLTGHIGILTLFSLFHYFIRRKPVYTITSLLIGITTFCLIQVLSRNEFGIAAGLGLFAIFGIIRYRTEQVPILEMTYMFMCITISVIGALTDGITLTATISYTMNGMLIIASSILFKIVDRIELQSRKVTIDGVDWLGFQTTEQIDFLCKKSFCQVETFEIDYIDWLKEVCHVTVHFRKP